MYSQILRKIGVKLVELELESEFIWDEDKEQLKNIVKELFLQLKNSFK